MQTCLHPRDYQVLDLVNRGVEARMVAATVGLSLWRVHWLRLRLGIQLFVERRDRESANT